jgi:hypothetical protein
MWNAMNRIISNCLAKSTSTTFPVTPFPAVRTGLPINATTQGLGSSATAPSPALLPNMPTFGDFTSSASLPDPTALGSIEMLEPDIMFDWVHECIPLKEVLPLTKSTRDFGTLIQRLLVRFESQRSSGCLKQILATLRIDSV